MNHPLYDNNNFSEEELKELLKEINNKWENDDPIIQKFVNDIKKMKKTEKMHNTIQVFEEIIIKVIAEFLKRVSIP